MMSLRNRQRQQQQRSLWDDGPRRIRRRRVDPANGSRAHAFLTTSLRAGQRQQQQHRFWDDGPSRVCRCPIDPDNGGRADASAESTDDAGGTWGKAGSGTMDPVGSGIVGSIRETAVGPMRPQRRLIVTRDGNDNAMGRYSRARSVRGGSVGARESGDAQVRSGWGARASRHRHRQGGVAGAKRGQGIALGR